MGNLLSQPEEITTLQTKVEELDRNKDGLVSKQEFQLWSQGQIEKQKESLEAFKENLILEYEAKYGPQINQLKRENEALKTINAKLEAQLTETHNVTLDNENGRPLGEISKERISKTVEHLIHSETNIKWLPDFVERQLYRNIFSILLGLLDEITTTTSMEILGHTLTMNLEAKKDQTPNHP